MEFLLSQKWVGEIITSLITISGLLLVRVFLIRLVKSGPEVLTQDQRRWQVRIKNTTWIAMLVILFFIWAPQLQTLALSITAFALAVVIATKELISCLIGGLLRNGARAFKVGDWLSVDGTVGEVVDVDSLGIKLQDIDVAGKTYQFTGKTHYIFHSKLLVGNFSNLTHMKKFVVHEVQVTLQYVSADTELLMGKFQEVTEKHFAPHREEAKQYIEEFKRASGFDLHDAEPQLFLDCKEFGHYVFTARLLLPTKLAAGLKSDITREFVSLVHRDGYSPMPAPA